MKRIFLVPILVLSLPAWAAAAPVLSDIASLEWKNRIVLVSEPHDAEDSLRRFEQQRAEIDDRHIIWFIVQDDRTLTNYPGGLSDDFVPNIRARLGPAPGAVTLIGKDGGIKSRSDHLDLETIFADIDVMPMRRREMQQ